ncbi:hypothetical protein [Bacillus suaedaesalsae]|uniref:Amino acid transporter n=1 Tax=Bacillus suaedaesalsae TaxID=2810349 RepID=A0ABS2DLS5_9BACI|nr:hypothetical protein [Bacillus suaedaesalsae]MBM6619450.1 hypothetical protein [Bacillus suaedaesalsae]
MSDRKPINDAMDHMNGIEGYPTNVDLKSLPKPLRYFGYFFISFFVLFFITFFVLSMIL